MSKPTDEQLTRLLTDIDSLVPDEKNARLHDERNLEAIKQSLQEFGWRSVVVARRSDRKVLAGHGRIEAAQLLGWTQAPVLFVEATDAEAASYALADNRTSELASWDEEQLAQTLSELTELDIQPIGFDADDLANLIESISQGTEEAEGPYTETIVSPVYEAQGEKPSVSDLVDTTRFEELVTAIKKAELPDEVREFLLVAAGRHAKFRFDRIADFYAHAEPGVQRLFEDSALVIIDFNKAIEQGFVRMNEELKNSFLKDVGTTDE